MCKYPSEIGVSETCIDANLKMVERQDPGKFPCFPRRDGARGQYRKLSLSELHLVRNLM